MIIKKNHPFHLVDQRPWPIIGSLRALIIVTGTASWFSTYQPNLITLGIVSLIIVASQWWRDVSRESTFQGIHTTAVIVGIKWGILIFITSEVLFFFSFFWAFFHSSLSPTTEIGLIWPPVGVETFNPALTPLLNTIILLSSGASITLSHHALAKHNKKKSEIGLLLTVVLGVYFSALQYIEYIESPFSISDSVYGASFFTATGFHGLHVLVGTTFLLVSLLRISNNHFSAKHHFGFEAAAWYWHFVDVVWLFLYINLYWWGIYVPITISKFNFQLESPSGGRNYNNFQNFNNHLSCPN